MLPNEIKIASIDIKMVNMKSKFDKFICLEKLKQINSGKNCCNSWQQKIIKMDNNRMLIQVGGQLWKEEKARRQSQSLSI